MGGFSAPIAAAPVLIPTAGDDKPKWLLPTLIGGGVVLVGAIVALVVVLMTKKPPEPIYVAGAGQTNPEAAKPKAADPKTEPKTPPEVKPKAAEPGGATENKVDPSPAKPRAGASVRRKKPPVKRTARPASPARAPQPRAPSKPRRGGRRDALDDLIDGAVGPKKKKGTTARKAPTGASSNLPEKLTRPQIVAGMRAIRGRVQGCFDRYKVPGMANVQMTINRNGRVSSAVVKGMFSGTPTGACVQAAVRSSKFPAFKGPPMTIYYPFILR